MKELCPIKLNFETNVRSLVIKTKIDPWKDIIDFKKMASKGWFTKYHGEFDYYSGSVEYLLRVGKHVYPVTFIAYHDNLYLEFLMFDPEYDAYVPTPFGKRSIVLPKQIISYIESHAIFEFGYEIYYLGYATKKSMKDKKIINLLEPILQRKGIAYMNFDWKTLQLIQDQDVLKCLAEGHYPAIMPYGVVDKNLTEMKSGILYQRMITSCMSKNKKFKEKIRSKIDYEATLSMLVEIGAVHRKLLPLFGTVKIK